MDKATLLRSIRASHATLTAALGRLSDDELLAPAQGEWTRKDVVAHVAYWQESSAKNIEALRAGRVRPEAERSTDDRNADALTAHRDRPAAEVRAWEAASFDRLVAMLEASDEAELVDAARYPVLGGDSIAAMVIADTTEHYEEHLPHLNG